MNPSSAAQFAGPSHSTVASLFAARAHERPDAVAIREDAEVWTYAQTSHRVRRLAGAMRAAGIGFGDRVAVLSENRHEYLETFLAAAWLGAIVACQNWRLAPPELEHCLTLVNPKLVIASSRHVGRLEGRWSGATWLFEGLGPILDEAEPVVSPVDLDPEAPLIVLYTSGTTGRPKGAVISHRAEIARNMVCRAEYHLAPTDAFVAWAPMYHLGGAEYSLGTLMSGGEVQIVDGFEPELIADVVASRHLGWLILMPGMVGRFADVLAARLGAGGPRGVKVCGVMPDLVPPSDLARVTTLLDAPYANTFGATETGNPPASAGLIPKGSAPTSMSKTPSVFCEIRLVDADGCDVADGTPGELCMRGPTLFSGYWDDEAATAEAFADGWFHMGDVFVRRADGNLDFVDRVKYLIKSGGENVYPAEIERVMLAHPSVAEAAVVRQPDARWGEVPVAFVACRDGDRREELAAALKKACLEALARFKQPKAIHFIGYDDFPRSASGKVQRHELEGRLASLEDTA